MPNLYDTIGIIKNGEKKKLPIVMVSPQVDEPDYVEVTADGVKTVTTLLGELFALIDISRISDKSSLVIGDNPYVPSLIDKTNSIFDFNREQCSNSSPQLSVYRARLSASPQYRQFSSTSMTDFGTYVFPSGTKFDLYYSTYTLDLTTKAENCIFDPTGTSLSSTNAEDAIKEVDGKVDANTIHYEDVQVRCSDVTWTASTFGKYYYLVKPAAQISGTVIATSIVAWSSLRASDNIQAIYDDDGAMLLSDTNSFASTNTRVTVRIVTVGA